MAGGMGDILSDVSKVAGDVTGNPLAPSAEVVHGLADMLDGKTGPSIAEGMQQLGSQLQVDLHGLADLMNAHVIDAVADPAGSTATASGDAGTAGQPLLDLNNAELLLNALKDNLQQRHDVEVDVSNNLHADAGSPSDGAIVAVADPADGHTDAHVDPDAGTNHPADHGGAVATHDDTTATDPSAAA
jgi:hypothetical protein